MTSRPAIRLRAQIALVGLLFSWPIALSAQAPASATEDSIPFQMLTNGMPADLKDRYREAIAQDPVLRVAFFGQSSASRSYGTVALEKRTPPPPAQALVKKGLAGVVRRTDGSGVRVPVGALDGDLRITVAHPDAVDESMRARQAEIRNLRPVSLPVEFGPTGTNFRAPVTITLAYDPDAASAQGFDEAALKVCYWNATTSEWEIMSSVVDKINKTVSAQTTHFSSYQAMGAGGISVAAADAALSFKAAYAFPNPLRGQGTITFRIQPGLADSVEIHVYDLSGRKIHSSSNFRSVGAFDDGNGLGPQFTYEHAWDTAGIGSGVYSFAVVARRSGEKDIRKSGKVAVIK